MAKHVSPSAHLQVVESPKTVAVQISLPILGALVDAMSAPYNLCVSVGRQVLGVLMEHAQGPVGSTHAGGDCVRRVDAQVRAEPRAAPRGGGGEHLEERHVAAFRGAVPAANDSVAHEAA